MTILVAAKGWDGSAWAERMRGALPDRRVEVTGLDGLRQAGDTGRVDYLLGWGTPQELLDSIRPKILFSLGAGVDHLLSRRLPDGVPVVRIIDPDLTARMVEYVVWQVLHHHRQAFHYAGEQDERRWTPRPQWPAGAVTVGIMGLGVLGQASAAALLALGFRVRGWSRSPKAVQGVESFDGEAALNAFLGGTDILVSLLPLTPETQGLIGSDVLAGLRRDGPLGGPVFINGGRGRCHVEAEVLAALRDDTLIGASLDVFETEPLPAESPLWDLPNLVVTPHVAAESNAEALVAQIARQILAFERGEPLTNLVDPQRGY